MLSTLSIRDVVLIEKLDLVFDAGLCVLTGETGAGKSILLDALGLALGARGDARLVRVGADKAAVTAAFDIPPGHPVFDLLAEQEIEAEEGAILLRRVLGNDGRSRAFVNDQPVSIGFLKQLAEALAEIHGQFENQRLLNPSTHRGVLDAFGGHGKLLDQTSVAYRGWRAAADARVRAEAALTQARRDEDFLRHVVDELNVLDPQPGEEDTLAQQRAFMMHGEKLIDALRQAADALNDGSGVDGAVRTALRHLERVADKAEGRLDPVIAAFDRASADIAEGMALLEKVGAAIDLDPAALEKLEERLFALRAAARKHNTTVDNLPAVHADLSDQLAQLESGGANLEQLRRAEKEARAQYAEAAEILRASRQKAVKRLDKAVTRELAPLHLEKAAFATRLDPLPEADWAEHGLDAVTFEVATNPGMPPGPLNRIASGGEIARFMLALKVVLAEADTVSTLIFDEVDAGVGGKVAAAVGERLAGLADTSQVLVVTHSPQVAARGKVHWRVAKAETKTGVVTSVEALDEPARREEIARMLSGKKITDEARAAAGSLLRGSHS
ncbi:MAG: DNA repair protein RecN [Rhodospirillales bacterium]